MTDHPAAPRFRIQAREDNPDREQRDAARATLARLEAGRPLDPDPPTADDLALRAFVANRPCCPGAVDE